MLQRIDPERIGDRILAQRSVRTVGTDHEFVAVTKEAGRDPEMLELDAGEIAEHRRSVGGLHGQRLVRAFPGVEFRSVTAGAGLGANEGRRLLGMRGRATHQRQYHRCG